MSGFILCVFIIFIFIVYVIRIKQKYFINDVEEQVNKEIKLLNKDYKIDIARINKNCYTEIIRYSRGKYYITNIGKKYIEHELEKIYPARLEDYILIPSVTAVASFFAGLFSAVVTLAASLPDKKETLDKISNFVFIDLFPLILFYTLLVLALLSTITYALNKINRYKKASLVILRYIIDKYVVK